MPRRPEPWGSADQALYAQARSVLGELYRAHRHTVASALRAGSGKVYTGICLDGLHSPCAETIAFGCATMAGESAIRSIVAVSRRGVISPCGNCRQMLIDYAPSTRVLVLSGRRRVAVRAEDLLPYPFRTFE